MDQRIIDFLKQQNINVQGASNRQTIDEKLLVWMQWYQGKVESFHNYKIYQGNKSINVERKSLGMGARIPQRWADLLLNEKVEINAADEYTQEVLNRLLKSVNFRVRGNNLIEYAFALGGGFFIEYYDGEKTALKYVSQMYFYPISYDSGKLTEAAFASEKYIDGNKYIYLETHLRDKETGFYTVDNILLPDSGDGKKLSEVPAGFYKEHGLSAKWETQSRRPLFQMVKPNIANKDDFNSPYGTSVFSGATDTLKTLDIIFDSYCKEFQLGKKRLFVGDGVAYVNYDKDTGAQIPVFDPQDEVFYRIPHEDGDQPITEINGTLRISEHSTGIQDTLNMLSQLCGFGSNGFKWESGKVSTATGIISQNSEMFRTLKKHEELLREAIVEMCHGLLYVEKTMNNDKRIIEEDEITVNFDDSIIEDTAEIQRRAILELNMNLIDDIEYYMTVYKMTKDQAIAYRDELRARAPAVEQEPNLEE